MEILNFRHDNEQNTVGTSRDELNRCIPTFFLQIPHRFLAIKFLTENFGM